MLYSLMVDIELTPFIIDSIRNAENELIYQGSNPIVCPTCEGSTSTTNKNKLDQKTQVSPIMKINRSKNKN